MPETLRLSSHLAHDVDRAAHILQRGGLVAFPTETVFGLGANALSVTAVQGIFAAKGRPSWDPLIVHLAEAGQLHELAQVEGELARRVKALAEAFWPGPLTLLLPRRDTCPPEVSAGRPLVGLRVPAHPAAQALLRASGLPIAAPSANRFGHVSPTTAEHVLQDLDGRIEAVLDGLLPRIGVESTVLDPAPDPMILYRAGAITSDMLCQATGVAAVHFKPSAHEAGVAQQALPSPGVGLRHYAPELTLLLTGPDQASLLRALEQVQAEGSTACVLLPADWHLAVTDGTQCIAWGQWAEPESLAAELFGALRIAEKTGASVAICPLPEPGGLRDALRDRLQKAAIPR